MKAIRIHMLGEPEVMQLKDVPEAQPVLVRPLLSLRRWLSLMILPYFMVLLILSS
jgi:hypothetical protein